MPGDNKATGACKNGCVKQYTGNYLGITGRTSSDDLMLGAQAPRAQVKALLLAVDSNGSRVDVWGPTPVGPALGMAHVMTEQRRFTA